MVISQTFFSHLSVNVFLSVSGIFFSQSTLLLSIIIRLVYKYASVLFTILVSFVFFDFGKCSGLLRFLLLEFQITLSAIAFVFLPNDLWYFCFFIESYSTIFAYCTYLRQTYSKTSLS